MSGHSRKTKNIKSKLIYRSMSTQAVSVWLFTMVAPRAVHVRFLVDKVALGQVLL
jgi:hypothetical protein